MKKEKYYYNPNTLQYERSKLSIGQKIFRVLGFLSSVLFFAFLILLFAYGFFQSPEERKLSMELKQMEISYNQLTKRMKFIDKVLIDLENRDNRIYRVIFEADPIDASVRKMGDGGSEENDEYQNFSTSNLISSSKKSLENIEKQIYVQSKSFDELAVLIKKKSQLLAAIPSIQPISNKDLTRIASGFGYRIDPVYKTIKFHAGLDFTCPTGTPIYATGDGVVEESKFNSGGYGNNIIVNHGYGYKTHYCHCSKLLVSEGEKVIRGQVIGLVGSTGKSTGPHLHYEVYKGTEKIDPINFFFNDLTPAQYEQMVNMAEQSNQSFD